MVKLLTIDGGEWQMDELRKHLTEIARSDLEKRHPNYVSAVRTFSSLTTDLEAVFEASKLRVPQNVRHWPEVFSAIFDVGHVRTKFTSALAQAKRAAESDLSNANEEFDYHREHWTFQGAAFIDRVGNALKKTVRVALRPYDQDWAIVGKQLSDQLHDRVSSHWGKVRNPLAHQLGGGVDALTDYWLLILAMEPRVIDVERVIEAIDSSTNEAKTIRDLSHLANAMDGSTLYVLAEADRLFGQLLEHLQRIEAQRT